MLARSSLCAVVRITAVAAATVFCASATIARAPVRLDMAAIEPPTPAVRPPPQSVTLAAVEPANPTITEPAEQANRGPFGLAAIHTGGMAERWSILQPLISIERQILARCRAEPSMCTPAAAKFAAIVAAGLARSGLARVGEINRAVNLAIRPMSDLAQYGFPDIWASPLMTFTSGAGDCEDYAIAKYVALRESGMALDDLRLVVVYNRSAHEDHMVAAARIDGRWLILDNRTMRLVRDQDIADLTPLVVLDSADPSPAIAMIPSASPDHVSSESSDAARLPVDL